jgi:prolipoprotein diacylglyceryl transferase
MPSPGSPELRLGPLHGHWYGLLVALGAVVFACVTAWLAARRGGDAERTLLLCLAALPAALVGARIYHLVTGGSGPTNESPWAISQGGLGIFGAVAGGGLVLAVGAPWAGLARLRLLDLATPGLSAGQAIGRVGNWFNQELYGKPTSLPWGLEIDPAHRLPGYANVARYQPTFLYEALWDLALAAILLRLLTRPRPLRSGIALGIWLVGYGVGRFWIEGLRIEPAHHLGPLRLNQVVALGLVAAGGALVVARARVRA